VVNQQISWKLITSGKEISFEDVYKDLGNNVRKDIITGFKAWFKKNNISSDTLISESYWCNGSGSESITCVDCLINSKDKVLITTGDAPINYFYDEIFKGKDISFYEKEEVMQDLLNTKLIELAAEYKFCPNCGKREK